MADKKYMKTVAIYESADTEGPTLSVNSRRTLQAQEADDRQLLDFEIKMLEYVDAHVDSFFFDAQEIARFRSELLTNKPTAYRLARTQMKILKDSEQDLARGWPAALRKRYLAALHEAERILNHRKTLSTGLRLDDV